MASAWQSVLAAHQRIVDNGGMPMIAHNFTEFASNFKNLRLQQIFSGCKTNVWGGAGGGQMFSPACDHNDCFMARLLTGPVT